MILEDQSDQYFLEDQTVLGIHLGLGCPVGLVDLVVQTDHQTQVVLEILCIA